MPRYSVDITNCDQEPIHLIGEIQSYGTLVAADTSGLVIRQVAANTEEFLGRTPEALLGSPVSELIEDSGLSVLSAPRWADAINASTPTPAEIAVRAEVGDDLDCLAHINDEMAILEFWPRQAALSAETSSNLLRQRLIRELTRPETIEELSSLSVKLCRLITGYDRAMIYKFHEDGHGQVIAESTQRRDSFLGLHYPASDIPAPARRHFLLNMIRIIADVDDVPSPLEPSSHPIHGRALDLTFSKLRAVSPVHIQYLKNMGVHASLSISLVVNGELWGLIACHHYQPRRLSAAELRLCELLGSLLGSFLQGLDNTDKLNKTNAAESLAFDLETGARETGDLVSMVEAEAASLMALTGSQGLALNCADRMLKMGKLPDPMPPLEGLRRHADDGLVITTRLADFVKLSEEQIELCAGGAFLMLSEDGSEHIFFSRENYAHTVEWAGDPSQNTTDIADGEAVLGPRSSFALWRQEVNGVCEPFSPAVRESLRILRRALYALRSAERERFALAAQAAAEAEKTRLQVELLEASRKNTLGELASVMAHELNQPLAALVNYVNACRQRLKQQGRALPTEVMNFMDEAVSEASRAGTLVRRLRGLIEQGELELTPLDINDTIGKAARLALSASSASDVELSTHFDSAIPRLWADRVQIEQLIFNLVRNSVEAMEGTKEKTIAISTQRLNGSIEVSIRDAGHGLPSEIAQSVFDPFKSTKPSGMGIGLSLCRSIIMAHGGSIQARNTDSGAEFVFTLPNKEMNGTDG